MDCGSVLGDLIAFKEKMPKVKVLFGALKRTFHSLLCVEVV